MQLCAVCFLAFRAVPCWGLAGFPFKDQDYFLLSSQRDSGLAMLLALDRLLQSLVSVKTVEGLEFGVQGGP